MLARRRFAQATAGSGLAAVGLRPTFVSAEEGLVKVTSLGGRWEQSIWDHFTPLFKKRTGADVQIVLGAPTQWEAQVEALPDNPPLDVIGNSETLGIRLIDKGMVEKLTVDKVPNLADIPATFRDAFDDFGVAMQYSSSGIFYNYARIAHPPSSWAEFFERAGKGEFGRSITLPDITYSWGPNFVWHCATCLGGSIDDLDSAFESLRKVKPYMVKFWGTALDVERMMLSREVDTGVLWDGRVIAMANTRAKFLRFARLAPNALMTASPCQVVKGGNERLAFQWVNTLLDPEPQLEYLKLTNFGITNSRVIVPEDLKPYMLPTSQGARPDYRALMKATPAMIDRWNREIRS